MQRFYCDWCKAEQRNAISLQPWAAELKCRGGPAGHFGFEICAACSTAAGLPQDPASSGMALGDVILSTLLEPLRERAKSLQRASMAPENRHEQ